MWEAHVEKAWTVEPMNENTVLESLSVVIQGYQLGPIFSLFNSCQVF